VLIALNRDWLLIPFDSMTLCDFPVYKLIIEHHCIQQNPLAIPHTQDTKLWMSTPLTCTVFCKHLHPMRLQSSFDRSKMRNRVLIPRLACSKVAT
jgi:hypothetical protein